jgi:SsrA-binding protein
MTDVKTVAVNRKARFEYDILDTFEAGLVLAGTEIKAIREGRANIGDAFAKPESGELWLVNAHIAHYSAGGVNNHDPDRPRKLLLHRDQIAWLTRQVNEKGLTIVPLMLYLKRHRAKVELGLARGRRRYDKRRAIIERQREREAQEAVRRPR